MPRSCKLSPTRRLVTHWDWAAYTSPRWCSSGSRVGDRTSGSRPGGDTFLHSRSLPSVYSWSGAADPSLHQSASSSGTLRSPWPCTLTIPSTGLPCSQGHTLAYISGRSKVDFGYRTFHWWASESHVLKQNVMVISKNR